MWMEYPAAKIAYFKSLGLLNQKLRIGSGFVVRLELLGVPALFPILTAASKCYSTWGGGCLGAQTRLAQTERGLLSEGATASSSSIDSNPSRTELLRVSHFAIDVEPHESFTKPFRELPRSQPAMPSGWSASAA
jgi:hypothetical protein